MSEIKPALFTERYVDEDDVRPERGRKLQSFSACRCNAEDPLSLPLKETSCNISE